ALEQHTRPTPALTPEPPPSDPPPVNSVRRPASASRTYGRYAGALRALHDPAAYLDAPTNRRRTTEEKISYTKRRLTGPAASGMTGLNGVSRWWWRRID